MSNPTISTLLDQQLARLDKLLSLLQRETQALLSHDLSQIEQLLKGKLELLTHIEQTDQQIAAHPERALLTQEPHLLENVKQAKLLLAQCQQHNQHNQAQAERVNASLTRLQTLLLRTCHASSVTYTDKGHTHAGQRLGKRIQA